MELADVVDSKSTAGDSVPVRVRPPAPQNPRGYIPRGFYLFRHLISSRFFIEIMSYICYIHFIDYKKRLHMYLVLIAFLWLLLEFIYPF